MFTPNLIVGLTIMVIGLVLILERLGLANMMELMKYWPVLLVLFGGSVAYQALRRKDPSLPPQRPVVSPGLVLVVVVIALLATSGFRGWGDMQADAGGDRVNLFGVMSSPSRTSTSSTFRGAHLGGVMGRSTLDLRNASIAPGEDAVVDVFVAMGKVVVRVPDNWTVDTSALPVMGSVDDERWPRNPVNVNTGDVEPADPAAGKPPRLVLRGFVLMGKVEIQS